MLSFLYLAGILCKLPIFEHDILQGAQSNKYGYFTEHKRTVKLFPELRAQIIQTLRPINVAHKNKWLRDTSRDLDKTIQLNLLNQQGYPKLESSYEGALLDHLRLIKARLQELFALPWFVVRQAE